MLAGSRSLTAIGEWAADLSVEQLERLGLARAPEESTLRKLFARLDGTALDRVMAVLAWTRTREIAGRRVIAIDGKTIRGARIRTRAADAGSVVAGHKVAAAPHLVAALDHRVGVVLGQLQVPAKTNEIPAVRDLLAGFDPDDLAGSVLTLDALHTQTDTAQLIVEAGADYVLTVKGNRPGLQKALKALPWNKIPVGHQATDRGHGRRVTRTIKVLDAPTLPDWPEFTGAAQVAQLRRTATRAGKKSVEVVYLITSASHADAPPAVLASWVVGHWSIENKEVVPGLVELEVAVPHLSPAEW